jgi:hypothetical protein
VSVPSATGDLAEASGKSELSPFGILRKNWVWIWILSLLLGSAAYAGTVIGSYFLLQTSMRSAPVPQLQGFSETAYTPDLASRVASSFDLAAPATIKWIDGALKAEMTAASQRSLAAMPTVDFLAGLLIGNSRCKAKCSPDCRNRIIEATVRLIGGWPGGWPTWSLQNRPSPDLAASKHSSRNASFQHR